jgi:small basic protein
MMPDRVFIPRLFLISGGVLAVAGVGLWYMLPIPSAFPPYLVTALLALVYGVVWNCRRGGAKSVKP